MTSRSITTEVSSSPDLVSATRDDVLVDVTVEVFAVPAVIDMWGATKCRGQRRPVHGATTAQRYEFTDRPPLRVTMNASP